MTVNTTATIHTAIHISALIETEDIGWEEAIEQLAPSDWAADRRETREWLAQAFLDACNGNGIDLNDPAPWGYIYDEWGNPEREIEPPAHFEWEGE